MPCSLRSSRRSLRWNAALQLHSDRVRALWLENRQLRLRADVPRPGSLDEALIRLLLAGICNTDLELKRGYYPFSGIPGHEFVGVVEQGPADLMGRRVTGEINAICGTCSSCLAARSSHCLNRTVLGIVNRNGAFADYLSLPSRNLHVVPDNVADEEAVFTEPLAAALRIQEQVNISAVDRVLIVGDGKLGQLVAQTVAMTGCRLTVVGRHRSKLDLLEARGITTAPGDSVVNGSFDIAIECTGNAQGFALARSALRARGTLVLKSTYADDLTLNASRAVVDEITLIGSRCGPFAPAMELLRSHRVEVRSMIHATYRLSDALAAFEHASRPGVLKVLIRA